MVSDVTASSCEPDRLPQPATDPRAELLSIRQQLRAALARCDRLLAAQLPLTTPDSHQAMQVRWRVSPGGPLSSDGVSEIQRRFRAGETDAVIARERGITVQGVAKRRADFNALIAARRRPGAMKGQIWMAPDFDELPAEELDAIEGRGE